MLLGVVAECSHGLLEAGLHQTHGGEGHAGPAASLNRDTSWLCSFNRLFPGMEAKGKKGL